MCGQLCEKTSILKFLLKRLEARSSPSLLCAPRSGLTASCTPQVRKFDANKLYASEILAILMQSEPENVVRLSNLSGMDGVDMLLQVIAYYKRRVPSGLEEEECVENLFNALCAVMNDNNANREKFCKSEGFELMLRCMRERKHAAHARFARSILRPSTVRPTASGSSRCCSPGESPHDAPAPMTRRRTLPLQIGGLKTVFPAFMGRGAVKPRALPGGKKRKRGLDEKRTCEEHVISIIASLSFHLVEVGPRALGFSFGFRASKSVSRARSGTGGAAQHFARCARAFHRQVSRFGL